MVTPNVNLDSDNSGVYKSQQSRGSKNFEKVERKEHHKERQEDSGKKFKPVDESDVSTKQEFDVAMAKGEAATQTKKTTPATSLFNVIEGNLEEEVGPEETVTVKEIPPEMNKGSLSALFQGLGTKEKLLSLQKQVSAEKPIDTPVIADVQVPEKPKFTTVFTREQPDLTTVNPMAGIQTNAIEASGNVTTPLRTQTVELQDLIDQMVEQLTIVSDPNSGKTETTISLKNPPIFEGANLTVTAFKSAKGEFNITFENLTQHAKAMIDLTENQNVLRNSLEQKGYMVHIVIATTTPVENTQTVKGEQLGSRNEDEGQGRGREKDEEQEG